MTTLSETQINQIINTVTPLAYQLMHNSLQLPGHHHWIVIHERRLAVFAQGKVPEGSEMIFELTKYQRCVTGIKTETVRLMDIVSKKVRENKL